MALTPLEFSLKALKATFFLTLLLMILKETYVEVSSSVEEPKNDASFYDYSIQFVKTFIKIFLYLSSVILSFALLAYECCGETEDDTGGVGRYTIYDRKLSCGYIKETTVQTETDVLAPTFFLPRQARSRPMRKKYFGRSILNEMIYSEAAVQTDADAPATIFLPSQGSGNPFNRENYSGFNMDEVSNEIEHEAGAELDNDNDAFGIETNETADVVTQSSTNIFSIDFHYQQERERSPPPHINGSAVKSEVAAPSSCDVFLVEPESSVLTFASLGGIQKLKQILDEFVIKPFVAAASEENFINVPRGIMFIGSSGAGKSSIVQAIVNELRSRLFGMSLKFYKVDGSNCFGTSIGYGASFRNIFRDTLGRSTFVIILFDNIDRFYDTSVSTFLYEMSSISPGRVLVIATARNRERTDERLLQIGSSEKFDYIFQIPLPEVMERIAILQIHFRKRKCPITDQQLADLANFTTSLNAGELENLVVMINEQAKARYLSLTANSQNNWNQEKGPLDKRVCARLTSREKSAYESFMNKMEINSQSEVNFADNNDGSSRKLLISKSASVYDRFNYDDSDSQCSMLTRLARLITNKHNDKQ